MLPYTSVTATLREHGQGENSWNVKEDGKCATRLMSTRKQSEQHAETERKKDGGNTKACDETPKREHACQTHAEFPSAAEAAAYNFRSSVSALGFNFQRCLRLFFFKTETLFLFNFREAGCSQKTVACSIYYTHTCHFKKISFGWTYVWFTSAMSNLLHIL